MTDAAVPPAPAPHVSTQVSASAGARTLLWGAGLTALALICMVLGSQPASDGSDGYQPALVLGWIVGAVGLPVLLIGIIAVGVRMGLDDHHGR